MKKLLSYVLVMTFCMMASLIGVKAATIGDITNTSEKDFKFTITDAKDWVLGYTDFKEFIRCEGEGTTASTNPYGRNINSNSVTISCSAIKNDYKIIKFVLSDKSENKPSITKEWEINSNKKPSTTQPATTTPTTTVTTTTTSKSDNADLKSIEVKDEKGNLIALSPAFKKDVYKYNLTVEGKVEKVNIVPTVDDSKAKFTLSSNATKELKEGDTTEITITVTAENESSSKIYTLSIKREALSTDATLKNIKIKEIPSFKFEKTKETYNIKVPKNLKKLTITTELTDDNSEIKIENNENLVDGTIIKLTVTAPDGTKKLYKLNVIKEDTVTTTKKVQVKAKNEEKSPIIIMILSMVAFSLIGSIVYVARKK